MIITFSSCIREDRFDDNPEGNFEALWKIIDEQYCFLDYKNKNMDWTGMIYMYDTNNELR